MTLDEREFYATIERWRSRPFDWPTANCVHFGCDIARCWGVEYEVPACDTPAEAAEWIRAQGARSLYEFLRRLFGNPKPPLQAKRGWIAYCKGKGLSGAAIGAIERKALFVSERGLIQVPLAQVTCAFDPGRWRG